MTAGYATETSIAGIDIFQVVRNNTQTVVHLPVSKTVVHARIKWSRTPVQCCANRSFASTDDVRIVVVEPKILTEYFFEIGRNSLIIN